MTDNPSPCLGIVGSDDQELSQAVHDAMIELNTAMLRATEAGLIVSIGLINHPDRSVPGGSLPQIGALSVRRIITLI